MAQNSFWIQPCVLNTWNVIVRNQYISIKDPSDLSKLFFGIYLIYLWFRWARKVSEGVGFKLVPGAIKTMLAQMKSCRGDRWFFLNPFGPEGCFKHSM